MSMRPLGIILCAALTAGCSTVQDDLSRQVLQPPEHWLTEPADFGIAAEPFEIVLHSEASFTGFWLPNPAADGRTVVLFHGEDTNVGAIHPWYRFLHDAGFSVLVFDPRGYGRSRGTPSLRAWIYDLPALFDWLRARPDVAADKIAFYGTGLGSVAAMWAAKSQRDCVAMVFEGMPSLREQLRENVDDGTALGAYTLGFVEFAGLPEDFEPSDNASLVQTPALFIGGEHEVLRDRRSLLATFDEFAGPRDLWLLPATNRAPHGMSTHDGEYQRTIAAFLQRQFERAATKSTANASASAHLVADWRKVGAASTGGAFYEVSVTAQPHRQNEPIAVETAVVSGDAIHFASAWLEDKSVTVRMQLPEPPSHVSANRIFAAIAGDDGSARRNLTPLAAATRAINPIFGLIETVRHGQPTLDECRQLSTLLAEVEASTPLPPVLETEFADVIGYIGLAFAGSEVPEEKAASRAWLERAVAAAPEHPERHFWGGPTTTYGYPQQAYVTAAKKMLSR